MTEPFNPFAAAAAIHAKMRAAGIELAPFDGEPLDLSRYGRVESMCPGEPRNAHGFPVPGLPDQTDPPPPPPVPPVAADPARDDSRGALYVRLSGSVSGPGLSPLDDSPDPLLDVLAIRDDSALRDGPYWDLCYVDRAGRWHSAYTQAGEQIHPPVLWWALPGRGAL